MSDVDRVRLVSAAAVPARQATYLWHLRIVVAALTLLAGQPGLGKSTLVIEIIARLTLGTLPGEFLHTPIVCCWSRWSGCRARPWTVMRWWPR